MTTANGRPHKVMLMGDSSLLSDQLTHIGYECCAATPKNASHLFNIDPPDAVIATPEKSSIKFLKDMSKANKANTPLPVRVLLSDKPLDADLHALADIVIPADQLAFSLPGFMRLRDQKMALAAQMRAMEKSHKQSVDELNLLKNAIIHNVSHELKTPLLQVKSAVALLDEAIHDKDMGESQKLIDYAKNATTRLEAVIKNITQLAGSLEIRLEPVIVQEAIDYALRGLRRVWEHKDDISRIEVSVESDLPIVLADKKGLGTVLQLLIDNALKFSKGRIEIAAHRIDENFVLVSVRDYGIGIAQSELDSIFESFYQIDASSTRKHSGTGVGLAIVRLILDRHNVEIHVESQEGKGSIFSFTLPIIPVGFA